MELMKGIRMCNVLPGFSCVTFICPPSTPNSGSIQLRVEQGEIGWEGPPSHFEDQKEPPPRPTAVTGVLGGLLGFK